MKLNTCDLNISFTDFIPSLYIKKKSLDLQKLRNMDLLTKLLRFITFYPNLVLFIPSFFTYFQNIIKTSKTGTKTRSRSSLLGIPRCFDSTRFLLGAYVRNTYQDAHVLVRICRTLHLQISRSHDPQGSSAWTTLETSE